MDEAKGVCRRISVHDCEVAVGLEQNLAFVLVLAEMVDPAGRGALDAEHRNTMSGFNLRMGLNEDPSRGHRPGGGSERCPSHQ